MVDVGRMENIGGNKMNLADQVTNLQLSKRLKELGVKQEGLFAWGYNDDRSDYGIYTKRDIHFMGEDCIAFTVAEIGEMLPYYSYEIVKSFRFYDFICDHLDLKFKADTEADARAKCLVMLIENKLITL
jgi:hypothetical protein